jgi:hypothetical protein
MNFDPQALTQLLLLTSRYLVAPVQVKKAWQLKSLMVAVPVILATDESLCKTPKLLLAFNTMLRFLEGALNSPGWVKFTWKLLIPATAAPRPVTVYVNAVARLFASWICWMKKAALDHSLFVGLK